MKDSDRYERGRKKIAEIFGESGERVIDSLSDVAPDLGTYIVDFAFGEVFTRPGLDDKSREIATVAALTTLGHAPSQLAVHIHGALNIGCTRREIVEVLIQMAIYAGFPAALNGIAVAREVFRERDRQGLS